MVSTVVLVAESNSASVLEASHAGCSPCLLHPAAVEYHAEVVSPPPLME